MTSVTAETGSQNESVCAMQTKRTVAGPKYIPTFGFVDSHQAELALEEFRRLDAEGLKDIRILVAQRVPLIEWRGNSDRFGGLILEADYEDTVVTKHTRANLYITKFPGHAHQSMVFSLLSQIGSYNEMTGNLLTGGGTCKLPGKDRCPDATFFPEVVPGENPVLPRFISELEVTHRSVPEIERYVSSLFAGIPVLHYVFVHKVLSREVDTRRFAALSILFGRDGTGLATALDVVSCGTASLTPSVQNSLSANMLARLRELPVPAVVIKANPWLADPVLNPFITVPAASLFYERDDPVTGLPVMVAGAPAPPPDLQIDLWKLTWAANVHDPFC